MVIGDMDPQSMGLAFDCGVRPMPIVATNVPTRSEWSLIATVGLLKIIARMVIRRRTLRVYL